MASTIQIQDQPDGSISRNFVKVSGAGVTLADTNTAQTFTNKTFTTPTLTTPVISNATATVTVATLAGLGSTIADAAPIVSSAPAVIFATGGNNSVGIQLPVAVKGSRYTVVNDTAANGILKIYPQVNSVINGLSANSSFNIAANTVCDLIAMNTTGWRSLPLLPS